MKTKDFAALPKALLTATFTAVFLGACGPAPAEPVPGSDSARDLEPCASVSPAPLRSFGSAAFAPRLIELPLASHKTIARVWPVRSGRSARSGAGVVFVTGVDGGLLEPADRIYSNLGATLAELGVPSIFVQYRSPGELEPSVEDALAGAQWLREQGVKKIALVGWSFGGAVITHSAARLPEARTLIGFAPQAKDTEAISRFRGNSLLIFHSESDENVPYESASHIFEEAPANVRKELYTLTDADHELSGEGKRLAPVAYDWLWRELSLGSCST